MSQQPSSLFRERALEQVSTPDHLDQTMRATSVRGWLALAGLALLIGAIVVWSFVGSIPVEATGSGMLVRPPGDILLAAPTDGTVTTVTVLPDDTVTAGQAVATFQDAAGGTIDLQSPVNGRVLELLVTPPMHVAAGAAVVSFEATGAPLQALIYAPASSGKSILPGTTVHLSPSTATADDYGLMLGSVTRVAVQPASSERLFLVFRNQETVDWVQHGGPVLEVEVSPAADAATPSGFRWTTPNGPPFRITAGTLVTATFVLEERRPIDLVLPDVRG